MQVDLRVPVPVNASMKALPKRKGNLGYPPPNVEPILASMKALPKRKGNNHLRAVMDFRKSASMKALPKRKGNHQFPIAQCGERGLNESPSKKEGKYG